MADDTTQTPRPEIPDAQGVVWKVLDLLFAKGGRRDYDKRRASLIVIMFALLELVIRLGYHVIDRQFDAYSQAMTRVQTTEVEERRAGVDRTVKELDRIGGKLDHVGEKIDSQTAALSDLAATIREAFLVRTAKTSKGAR
jgi:hypothetical protein